MVTLIKINDGGVIVEVYDPSALLQFPPIIMKAEEVRVLFKDWPDILFRHFQRWPMVKQKVC